MTRPELAAAIRDLADEEKLDLLGELWDALDHEKVDGVTADWHEEELNLRLESAETATFSSWTEARARILGAK